MTGPSLVRDRNRSAGLTSICLEDGDIYHQNSTMSAGLIYFTIGFQERWLLYIMARVGTNGVTECTNTCGTLQTTSLLDIPWTSQLFQICCLET